MNIPHRACTLAQARPLALLCLALASVGCAGSEASTDDPLSGVARSRIDAGERQTCWIRAGGAIRCEGVALRGTSSREDGSLDDPEARILAAILPGTRLLHENPGGDRYELMTKLPPGAAPENGDWGFSRHLLDGTRLPLTSDSGYGPAAPTCLDCHEMANRRERTDLLWGIPRSAMP